MFARLTVYDDIDLDLFAEVHQLMEAQEDDPFAGLPGYRGSMTLLDRDSARLVGIGLYDSAEDAHGVTARISAIIEKAPEPARRALATPPASIGVYEIVQRDGGV
jgi:hypothetical protein